MLNFLKTVNCGAVVLKLIEWYLLVLQYLLVKHINLYIKSLSGKFS